MLFYSHNLFYGQIVNETGLVLYALIDHHHLSYTKLRFLLLLLLLVWTEHSPHIYCRTCGCHTHLT